MNTQSHQTYSTVYFSAIRLIYMIPRVIKAWKYPGIFTWFLPGNGNVKNPESHLNSLLNQKRAHTMFFLTDIILLVYNLF